MPLRRPPCDGQAQAMAGSTLAGGAEKGFAEPFQPLCGHTGAMITHADQQLLRLALYVDLDRLAEWIEAQGIAQQIVQCPSEHVWPTLQRHGSAVHADF